MYDRSKDKRNKRISRHKRIRKKIRGSTESPRLCVFRSNRHIYAQVIDDDRGVTLAASSSLKGGRAPKEGAKIAVAREVGKSVAEAAVKAGVKSVRFDRGGYLYRGRIAALAKGAREAGLDF